MQILSKEYPFDEKFYQGADIIARAKEFYDIHGEIPTRTSPWTRESRLL